MAQKQYAERASARVISIYVQGRRSIKAKALAACDPGGNRRSAKKKWRADPSLMEFLRKL